MWDRKVASTKQAADVKQTVAGQRNSDDVPKEREPSWVFKGYVAFCLHGCPVLTKAKDCIANFPFSSHLQGSKSS